MIYWFTDLMVDFYKLKCLSTIISWQKYFTDSLTGLDPTLTASGVPLNYVSPLRQVSPIMNETGVCVCK